MPVDRRVLDDGQLERLRGARFGRVVQLGETSSTNSVLVGQAHQGAPEGLVVVADHQTAGRGRFQRRWESQPGGALLFSVLMRPSPAQLPLPRRHLTAAAVAVALCEAAGVVAGVEAVLKWPNDVICGNGEAEAKLAGVLAEGAADGAVVVGAGVNVAWAPPALGPASLRATSLEAEAGRPVDRGEMLVATLLGLGDLYGHWGQVIDRYRRACVTVGRPVRVSLSAAVGAVDLVGTAEDLDEDGRLMVRATGGRLVTVAAGDVTHVRAAAP